MLRNFIITSLRILWRNRLVSAINIISLSIGITAFILILLYVHHETSFDKFNENYERIYRLEGNDYAQIHAIYSDLLGDQIPEIEKIVKLKVRDRDYNYFAIDDNASKSNSIQAQHILSDSTIFNVFTLPFIKGNPRTALTEPQSIVLKESTAKKLFGNEDPIGKRVYGNNTFRSDFEYQVTGVFKDVNNAHLDIDGVIPLHQWDKLAYDNNTYATFLLLTRHADPAQVEKKINQVLNNKRANLNRIVDIKKLHLRPLKEVYLSGSALKNQYGFQGNKKLIWSFSAIAIFVLLLGIINYLSLTTARSTLRSKEVIIKKARVVAMECSGCSLLPNRF